jgi:hypothetical protein
VLHLFRSPAPRYLPTAETDVPNVQEEVSFGLSGKSVPAFFAVFQSIRFSTNGSARATRVLVPSAATCFEPDNYFYVTVFK